MENDFYAVLGVSPTAEDCVIRAAYRALCQHHHPDKAPDKQREAAKNERLSAVNEAYAVLGDLARRKAYDDRPSSRTVQAEQPAPRPSLLGRLTTLAARGLVVAGSVLVADLVAVDEKPRYRWAWDALTSWGTDTTHYVVNWPLWLVVVAAGVAFAWRVGRHARRIGPD
jgi:hypothetical protein